MAENNEYNDLLYAYALGCLDQEDLSKLKKYFQSGEEFPWHELGEYQNLTALLPSILNIEVPSLQLKDKVARKLYRIKDQARTQRPEQQELKITNPPESPVKESTENEEKIQVEDEEEEIIVPENFSLNEDANIENIDPTPEVVEEETVFDEGNNEELDTEKLNTKTEEFEVVTPRRKTSENFRPHQETQIKSRGIEEFKEPEIEVEKSDNGIDLTGLEKLPIEEQELDKMKSSHQPELKRKRSYNDYDEGTAKKGKKKLGSFFLILVIFILLIAGLIAVYLKISSDVKVYQNTITNLNKQLTDLSQKVTMNQQLQSLLLTKDVRVIRLNGTPENPDGYGKLIISLDNSKGFLQLQQMPKLDVNEVYKLWVSVNGGYKSLGVFDPSDNANYYPISIPELSNGNSTEFLMTEEPSIGVPKPGKRIFLKGSLQ